MLGYGGGEEKGMGVWGKVRRNVRGVKKCGRMCGRVYGVSVESVRKFVGVWESYGWEGGWGSWSRGSWGRGVGVGELESGELGSGELGWGVGIMRVEVGELESRELWLEKLGSGGLVGVGELGSVGLGESGKLESEEVVGGVGVIGVDDPSNPSDPTPDLKSPDSNFPNPNFLDPNSSKSSPFDPPTPTPQPLIFRPQPPTLPTPTVPTPDLPTMVNPGGKGWGVEPPHLKLIYCF